MKLYFCIACVLAVVVGSSAANAQSQCKNGVTTCLRDAKAPPPASNAGNTGTIRTHRTRVVQ